jgi:hypothetical protein
MVPGSADGLPSLAARQRAASRPATPMGPVGHQISHHAAQAGPPSRPPVSGGCAITSRQPGGVSTRVLLPGCARQPAPGHSGTDPAPGGEPPCGGDTTALPRGVGPTSHPALSAIRADIPAPANAHHPALLGAA